MKRIWSNGMALLLTLAMLLPMLGMAQPVMADTGKGRVTDAADVGTATAVPNDHGGVSVGVTWESDGIVCATEETEGCNAVEALNVAEDGGYILPKTGGTGVVSVYTAGGMLALCGCAVLAAIRKRKDVDM